MSISKFRNLILLLSLVLGSQRASAFSWPASLSKEVKAIENARTGAQALAAYKTFYKKARAEKSLWGTKGPNEPGRLGIQGEPGKDGIVVRIVVPASAADMAGIRVGDIVVSANGKKVRDIPELSPLVMGNPKGKAMAILLNRNGKPLKLSVVPAPFLNLRVPLPFPSIFPSSQKMKGDQKSKTQWVMFSELLCPHCGPAYRQTRRNLSSGSASPDHQFFYVPYELGFDRTGLIVQSFACMMEMPQKYFEFTDTAFSNVSIFRGAQVKQNLEAVLERSGYGKNPGRCWTNKEKNNWLEVFRLMGTLKGVEGTPSIYRNGAKVDYLPN